MHQHHRQPTTQAHTTLRTDTLLLDSVLASTEAARSPTLDAAIETTERVARELEAHRRFASRSKKVLARAEREACLCGKTRMVARGVCIPVVRGFPYIA